MLCIVKINIDLGPLHFLDDGDVLVSINPLMHEVAVLFQICSEVMSSLGNHSSWLHSFK